MSNTSASRVSLIRRVGNFVAMIGAADSCDCAVYIPAPAVRWNGGRTLRAAIAAASSA